VKNGDLLRKGGVEVDGWYCAKYLSVALGKARGKSNAWVKDTEDRKPGIGMIKQAANDLGVSLADAQVYYIGDSLSDVQCGLNAGGKSVMLTIDNEKDVEVARLYAEQHPGRVLFAKNILEAAKLVLEDAGCM